LALERHFTLPSETGILIYPNRTAKSGKFDCKIVTLNTLLDYRIEENKEHSFELAILAECINEMLDRSLAFGIYKALHCAIDKDSEKKRREEAKLAEIVAAEGKFQVFEAEIRYFSLEATTEGAAEKIEKTDEQKKKEEEKRDEERKKALAEPRKSIVVDRVVYQAFAHFDQNQCG
uniref:LAIKA domain-containing protein n=1 Tax=Gongylonema pulchrum TaxID=637853 RepID=A0A183DDJ6_9BILA